MVFAIFAITSRLQEKKSAKSIIKNAVKQWKRQGQQEPKKIYLNSVRSCSGRRKMQLEYNTRDGKGNDILKLVQIKEFPVHRIDFECKICGRICTEGSVKKDVVSGNFTDHDYVGDWICTDCTRLFSLYFYSYIVEDGKISIFNVREARNVILRGHITPFKLIITKTGKKHLFYRCHENLSDDSFAIQLENETIFTTHERMRELFDFVECLMTLGASKTAMSDGAIPYNILCRSFGPDSIIRLRHEIKTSREIQIPLFLGQKREIAEEEAKCCIISILRS